MSERSPSESPLKSDRPADLADVTAAYAVYLGRRTDHPDQNVAWLGVKLSDLVAAFVSSAEFTNILEDLRRTGTLADPGLLSASERTSADRWLASLASSHRPTPNVEWGDLLLAALTTPELSDLTSSTFDAETLKVLGTAVEGRRSQRASLLDLTAFDVDAFLSSESRGRYRSAAGGIDFDAKIARGAPAPVLLPLFTEGLERLRRPGPVTLGDWLAETQDAAMGGSLSHWLWDETVYLRNRADAVAKAAEPAPGAFAFLDFLAAGDEAGISPHPLFCHQAYRMLNGPELGDQQFTFRHYAYEGDPKGLRTSALFDSDFYLALHPHVRDEIATGRFGSALEHFVRFGMGAGYRFSPDFDREFYLDLYPDVAQTIAEGSLPSAEWHYTFHGAGEGRAPNPFFDPRYYADRYPFVAEEMRRLGIATTIEHFLLLGRGRGWRVNQPLTERRVALDDGKALFERRGRRAFGEIMDGAVSIPVARSPGLSVIVPVSGQADFTAGFLKSAAFAIETLASRRGVETEIIVVDNGSTDHTAALLEAFPAVRLERFAEPIGFPAAVNAGARVARGDILLVVNNDIEFAPDAFARIVAALEDDPTVGVVGAKVILPNETLQEVGAMLDRLGSSHGFGRGADPAEVRGQRLIEVDYASACFVGFRRSDFEALSGFDEGFSPGYFEDVDFSLRMKRDVAKTTVVDTGLTVTHYEHASFSKGRPPSVNSALILRNRQRLKLAHIDRFKDMEAGNPRQRAGRARQAIAGAARVLFIADTLPTTRLGARARRQVDILDALTELGVAFDIAALTPSGHIDHYKDPRAKIFRAWMPGQSFEVVLHDHAAAYSHLWVCRPSNVARHAAAISRAKAEFDLTVICDAEMLPSRRTLEQTRFHGPSLHDERALSMADNDLVDTLDVDVWVAANEKDRDLIDRLGLGPAIEIGHGSDGLQGVADKPFAERDRVLFVGNADQVDSPACEDLDWLLREVWPRLKGMDGARLTVAGAWPQNIAGSFIELFSDRIDFEDVIDEASMSALYSRSRVAVAPGRFSTDQDGEAIYAIAGGVPVVMTGEMAKRTGLPTASEAANNQTTESAQSFADLLSKLYTDEARWRNQIAAQRTAAESQSERSGFVGRVRGALRLVGSETRKA